MEKSPDIQELAKALCTFQGAMGAITKDSENPFFKSKYASLSTIIEDVREPLAKNGLSYAQFPSGQFGLTTILMHTSGQWMSELYEMEPVDHKPQSVGSVLSYMRRYALSAILGLQVEDDDGNEATKPTPRPRGATLVPRTQRPVEVDNSLAQRARIADLLRVHGVDLSSRAACEAWVKERLNVRLIPSNYSTIITRLEALEANG